MFTVTDLGFICRKQVFAIIKDRAKGKNKLIEKLEKYWRKIRRRLIWKLNGSKRRFQTIKNIRTLNGWGMPKYRGVKMGFSRMLKWLCTNKNSIELQFTVITLSLTTLLVNWRTVKSIVLLWLQLMRGTETRENQMGNEWSDLKGTTKMKVGV